MLQHLRYWSFVLAIVIGLVGCTRTVKKPVPPPSRAIVGSWIGISDGDVYTYRLKLDKDGTGLLAYQFTDQSPSVYRISEWHLERRKLTVKVVPTPSSREPILIEGTVSGNRILLHITGSNWKTRIEMWNEKKILRRVESVRQVMEPNEPVPTDPVQPEEPAKDKTDGHGM
jgi:hypothetical protein